MTEREWWNKHVRKALNNRANWWRAEKTEDAFKAGMPDLILLAEGIVARCEMKFAKRPPKTRGAGVPKPLSTEQRRALEEWIGCGGLGWVLIGFEEERAAYLFNALVYTSAHTWFEIEHCHLLRTDWDNLGEVMKYLSSIEMK